MQTVLKVPQEKYRLDVTMKFVSTGESAAFLLSYSLGLGYMAHSFEFYVMTTSCETACGEHVSAVSQCRVESNFII